MRLPFLALPLLSLLAACGGSDVASSPTQLAPNAPPAGEHGGGSAPPAAPVTTNAIGNHKLAVAAASCWLGGVWADAIGEPPENRKQSDEARCYDVEKQVWGVEDKARFEQLRAFDEASVQDVLSKVGDGTSSARELRAFVEAQKEALEARRWGDKVKKDLTGGREPEKLTPDEFTASKFLQDGDALSALLKASTADLTTESHALGVLTAMERLEASRGLPKHLKIFAMQAPLHALFGLALPTNLPAEATQPLPKGGYLAYVTEAAKAAGHPVPDAATTPKEREPQAWAGILEGIADKLHPDVDGTPKDTQLSDIVDRVARRLDAQVKAEKAALASATAAPAGKTPPATGAPASKTAPAAAAKPAAAPAKKEPTAR
ncbi:MAG TPA: hypothetical protein VGI39_13655 [Polyangiaceae bacterium]|jgi:hypothetical protein